MKQIQNFGRNISFTPEMNCRVESESDVLAALKANPGKRFRAIGSLHAWSPAAATDQVLIETQGLNQIDIEAGGQSVWVGAGCQVKKLLQALSTKGLTLPSVGLIDKQTVAGATATATHGSGSMSLSAFIKAVRIAHFDSSGNAVITTVDQGDALRAARCSLGLLGIVVAIQFECRPKYQIEEHARAHQTLTAAMAMEENYPRQQFYLMPWSWTYFGHHRVESSQRRSALATLYRIYCFTTIDVGLHVVVLLLARILKAAWAVRFFFRRILPLTIARNWKVVDDSHAMLVMEHDLFRHIEIEVFVPRSKVHQATDFLVDVMSVFGDQPKKNPASTDQLLDSISMREKLKESAGSYVHHYPVCYRRVLPDPTLISTTSKSNHADPDEDWYAISFISYHHPEKRGGFFKFAEFIGPAVAELFGGRCHWGKHNPLDQKQNEELYPQLKPFLEIVDQFDAKSVFSNSWFDKVANSDAAQ